METPIPSSAFLKVGKQLVVKTPTTPAQVPVPPPIREPAPSLCHEITTYDILQEWAHLLIEYFGEYASPFM